MDNISATSECMDRFHSATSQQQLALDVQKVTARYRNTDKHGVFNVSLQLRRGELMALAGPNGAGKTTLIRVITGVLAPIAGRVLLFGVPMDSLSRKQIARRVAVVHQHANVALGFTVREVVAMGRAPHQGSMQICNDRDTAIVERAIELAELGDLQHRKVSALSGGEQKRVAIARAIAQQPDVLILDEAGAHLDLRHRVKLLDMIQDLIEQSHVACLSVMHDLNEIAQAASHVTLMNKGRVQAQGTSTDVMQIDVLEKVFRVKLESAVIGATGSRVFTAKKIPRYLDQCFPTEL